MHFRTPKLIIKMDHEFSDKNTRKKVDLQQFFFRAIRKWVLVKKYFHIKVKE